MTRERIASGWPIHWSETDGKNAELILANGEIPGLGWRSSSLEHAVAIEHFFARPGMIELVRRNPMTLSSVITSSSREAVVPAAPERGLDVPACVRRVRDGDDEAARTLLQHLYPLVITVVRGHLPRRMGEEDLAQMIFAKVFSKLEQFSGTVPLEHWVSRIAVNTCLNALQAEKIRPELRWADLSEEEEHVVQSLAASGDDLEPGQHLAARDLVEKLLEHLKPDDRLLLNLLHIEGRSIDDIRKITGWNISLIKVRAFRARRKLRKHLEALLKENGQ